MLFSLALTRYSRQHAAVAERDFGIWSDALPSTEIDGWRWGNHTDLDSDEGDAFVAAPDGSFAGLIWTANTSAFFNEVSGPGNASARHPLNACWGVYAVGRPLPMRDEADAREYLRSLLPDLVNRWHAWRSQTAGANDR